MPEEKYLLRSLHELLAYLGQCGVITMLVATQHGLIGNMTTQVDVSYLADSVILLRYYEARAGAVRNCAISVVKKRSGPHERTIREFSLGSSGIIAIAEEATARVPRRVLTGVPNYTGSPEALTRTDGAGRS